MTDSLYHESARARSALFALDAGCDRKDWVAIGMAFKAAGGDADSWVEWSSSGANYSSERDALVTWNSFKPDGGIGPGTLFARAKASGWSDEGARFNSMQGARVSNYAVTVVAKPRAAQKPDFDVAAAFASYPPASADHPYIAAKRGTSEGLRVVPDDDPLTICGKRVAGSLAVPVRSLDGTFRTVQFIPPAGGSGKLNAPGAPFADGVFVVGAVVPDGTLYVAEGIGQAWACAKADYHGAAVVAFGSGRIGTVAKLLRDRYPVARIVIVPDRGKEVDAATVARLVGGAWVEMPMDTPTNYDVNDYEGDHGIDALADILQNVKTPVIEPPLNVAFADELADRYEPPDELIEGVLTVDGGSILFGASNCGKTFVGIDMAAAVARGVPWMGRQTEQGLVVYLAAESPASVRARLQAYQKCLGAPVPNFAIVQTPVNLFESDFDTEAIIETVKSIEVQRGMKVRLIVGDTLARLSAGANENAGQDMSLVIKRFDRIRTECKAHFMLIHHSGKNSAAGARGWSGMRAAVDTEIEVTEAAGVRVAEITKQRDLPSKGERIGFRLETVGLGTTKWGVLATSCIVVPADAPEKPRTEKRYGAVEGAVLEYLAAQKVGIKKRAVVVHFEEQYKSGPVYRAMKRLVEAGAIHEAAGIVCIANAAK